MTLGECISNFILLSPTFLSIQRATRLISFPLDFPFRYYSLYFVGTLLSRFCLASSKRCIEISFSNNNTYRIYPSYFCVELRANVKLLQNDQFTAVLHPNKMMAPSPPIPESFECNWNYLRVAVISVTHAIVQNFFLSTLSAVLRLLNAWRTEPVYQVFCYTRFLHGLENCSPWVLDP